MSNQSNCDKKFYNEVPQFNFELKRGDNWIGPTFVYQDSSGNAIDLTSYTARLMIKDEVDGDNTYVSITSGAGQIVLGADGTIVFNVAAAATAAWTWEYGYYDLELTVGGIVTTIVAGRIHLLGDITV